MREIKSSGFEFKKTLPFLALSGMVLTLSMLAINPDEVRKHLRNEYRQTFKNLVEGSNEKEDVQMAIDNLPEGSEPVVAKWLNDALQAKSRAISKKQIKPHHVMYDVLMSALSLSKR